MARYEAMMIGTDKDYIQYPSPTQILGLLSKGDAIPQWSANKTIEYIYSNSMTYQNKEKFEIISNNLNLLNEARFNWKNTRTQTADLGSELHRIIEKFINIRLRNNNKKSKDEYILYRTIENKNLKQMFLQWISWVNHNVSEFLESEKPVVHRELYIAGTADFIYRGLDNKIYLCDLKTANSIYDTHEIQSCVYKYARESMIKNEYDQFGYKCNELPVKYKIRFNQDGGSWERTFEYPVLKINHCCILKISRDFFEPVKIKIIKNIENKMRAFECLLSYYYIIVKRQLNNKRARERK